MIKTTAEATTTSEMEPEGGLPEDTIVAGDDDAEGSVDRAGDMAVN